MAYFTKEDLFYKDYDWKAKEEDDNPGITGFPDNIRLARHEGYEVLYFINKIARENNWSSTDKAGGHKLEKMLRNAVPTDMVDRKAINCNFSRSFLTKCFDNFEGGGFSSTIWT